MGEQVERGVELAGGREAQEDAGQLLAQLVLLVALAVEGPQVQDRLRHPEVCVPADGAERLGEGEGVRGQVLGEVVQARERAGDLSLLHGRHRLDGAAVRRERRERVGERGSGEGGPGEHDAERFGLVPEPDLQAVECLQRSGPLGLVRVGVRADLREHPVDRAHADAGR